MFGLEKKPRAPFEFDLEKDLKAHPHKGLELIKAAEERAVKIKGILRKDTGEEHYDDFGILLHAYGVLPRVLKRIANKK